MNCPPRPGPESPWPGDPGPALPGRPEATARPADGGGLVQYRDGFRPRPFQAQVITSMLDGITAGRRTTIVLASPGSGKTLAYQAAATCAYRAGLADHVAVFVPRLALASQCELDWMTRRADGTRDGHFRLFDARCRFGPIRHVRNEPPLTPPGSTGTGYVATYSSLVASPVFRNWAGRHRGRYLLIADEAQFCGAGDTGTRAGDRIRELHELAAHTLLLTGTPYRSDGQPLVLASYDEPDAQNRRRILCHARADYRDGVREGYLRPFRATLHDARVRRKNPDGSTTEYDLSGDGGDLPAVLRQPGVWQPIADGVVEAVRERQQEHPGYRGLISCMEQQDARDVYAYLQDRYRDCCPRLRIRKAITDDGPEAERDLAAFKNAGDILVTVRKAFIGYDCKPITVVGVLTHYRDWGHLEQLVGRGLRTWNDAPGRQECQVIAPDDPRMTAFISFMRGESEAGLREREDAAAGGPGSDDGVPGSASRIESAEATTTRALSSEVSPAAPGGADGPADDTAAAPPVPGPAAGPGIPQTERQQIESVNKETAKTIRAVLRARGARTDDPGYQARVNRLTAQVNRRARCTSARCKTVEQARRRLRAAQALLQARTQ